MINLLPDEYKKTIHREHQLRILTINALFFCYLALISLALFFPSYILTRVRVEEARAEGEAVAATVGGKQDVGKIVGELGVAAQIAREIGADLSAPSVHSLLKLLDGKPTGIRVTEISFAAQGAAGAADAAAVGHELVLRGTARNRESLTSFNKFLSAQTQLSQVDIPISNFAKERNFEFTARVTVQP